MKTGAVFVQINSADSFFAGSGLGFGHSAIILKWDYGAGLVIGGGYDTFLVVGRIYGGNKYWKALG